MNYKIYITKTSDISKYYYIDFEDIFNYKLPFTLCINEFAKLNNDAIFYTASVGNIVYKQFKQKTLKYEV
jgi:hypothetical protein